MLLPAGGRRLIGLLLLLLPLSAVAPAYADQLPADDPALEQQITEDQVVATDEVVLERGHVDLGPRYDGEGEWDFMVHDDTGAAGPVWRSLDRTVLRVGDAAVQQVPDDPTYAFLGVPAGSDVHVVPQTEGDGVVWVGWNTQDPEVMSTVDRGVTLDLAAVEGPGELVVYLQDGGFGAPDVLWDSRRPEAQPLWVDVNTHTHANWVFTEPGVYLVGIRASAERVDGTTVSSTGTVRYVVGDAADAEEALAAVPAALPEEPSGAQAAAPEPVIEGAASSSLVPWALGGGLLAVLLTAAALMLAVRGRRVRRRAMEAA